MKCMKRQVVWFIVLYLASLVTYAVVVLTEKGVLGLLR